jgi:LemA protein
MAGAAVALGLTVVLVWAVMIYNRLVRARNQLREAWSGIEVQLKRRHDLVPSLVECVKGYQTHERGLLEELVRDRGAALAATDAASASGPESRLGRDLVRVIALTEDYPQLRADSQFLRLMRELVNVEEQLQFARRYYNGSARDMNNTVESFPSNLVARSGGFRTAAFFEVEQASERLPPDLARQLADSTPPPSAS